MTPKIDLIPSEGDNPEDVQTVLVKCPLFAECEVIFAFHPSAQQAAEQTIEEHLVQEHQFVRETNESNIATITTDNPIRPAHYTALDPEPIKAIEGWGLGFCLGNCVKYLARAGRKDPAKEIEDCEKAAWYLNRHIEQLKTR